MKKKTLPPKTICAPFLVNKSEYCFWDPDIPEINKRFLEQIDSNYFEYVADLNFSVIKNRDQSEIDDKTRQYSAMALRIAYSQGLEVLFSFLFAALQAPECVVGWLLSYTNTDLHEVVNSFSRYGDVLSKLTVTIREWKDFVNLVFMGLEQVEKEKISSTLDGFAHLWANFAQDFSDKSLQDEYNSIKHGLRVHMGGFHLLWGLQDNYGTPAPPERMETMSYSKFGTTFFISEKIGKTPNYVLHTQSRNWDPENFFHGLHLISVSIKNILVFLKKVNGEEKDLEYIVPNEDQFYLKPWSVGSGMSMQHKSQITVKAKALLKKGEILASYQKSAGNEN